MESFFLSIENTILNYHHHLDRIYLPIIPTSILQAFDSFNNDIKIDIKNYNNNNNNVNFIHFHNPILETVPLSNNIIL